MFFVDWIGNLSVNSLTVCFHRGAFGRIMRMLRSLSGPSYDGKYLHEVVRQKLGNTRLHQTLTNVVIPTFDIKRLQPTIFSSFEVSLSLTIFWALEFE
jgi:patatin-like phospholipase/acyl hydrolase